MKVLDPMEMLSAAANALSGCAAANRKLAEDTQRLAEDAQAEIWRTIRQHAPKCALCNNTGVVLDGSYSLCLQPDCVTGLLMRYPLLTLAEIRERGLK